MQRINNIELSLAVSGSSVRHHGRRVSWRGASQPGAEHGAICVEQSTESELSEGDCQLSLGREQ